MDNVFPGFANIKHISNQVFDNCYVYIVLYSVTIALLHSYNQWLNEKQCNDVIAVIYLLTSPFLLQNLSDFYIIRVNMFEKFRKQHTVTSSQPAGDNSSQKAVQTRFCHLSCSKQVVKLFGFLGDSWNYLVFDPSFQRSKLDQPVATPPSSDYHRNPACDIVPQLLMAYPGPKGICFGILAN